MAEREVMDIYMCKQQQVVFCAYVNVYSRSLNRSVALYDHVRICMYVCMYVYTGKGEANVGTDDLCSIRSPPNHSGRVVIISQ